MKIKLEKILTLFVPLIASLVYFLLSAYSMHSSGDWYYLDSDSYTRYLRINDWLNNFSWFEKIFPFSNCPNGEILHFTRINDIVWLLLSLPFMPFTGTDNALLFGGLIFAPTFFCLTLYILGQQIKLNLQPAQNSAQYLLVFALTFLFLLSTTVFYFGRPDHHCIMMFITASAIYLLGKPDKSNAIISGVLCAIGIWCSSAVEGGILCASISVALFYCWLTEKISEKTILQYFSALFFSVFVAFILNPPYQGYFYPDTERLSVVHVCICGLVWLSFLIITKINPHTLKLKLILSVGFSAVCLLILLLIFGKILFSPLYNEGVLQNFVIHISEMQPPLIYEYGYLILGCVALFLLNFRQQKNTAYLIVGIMFVCYLPLGATVRRFIYYSILLFTFLNIFVLAQTFSLTEKSRKSKLTAFIYLTADIFFLFSFQYSTEPLYPYQSLPKLNGCVLSDIFSAPYISYKTGANTLASPYHNNIEGISNTVKIFNADNEKEIYSALQSRHIKYIFVPKQKLSHLQNTNSNSLYNRLLAGKQYKWIEKISGEKENYLLYKVTQ